MTNPGRLAILVSASLVAGLGGCAGSSASSAGDGAGFMLEVADRDPSARRAVVYDLESRAGSDAEFRVTAGAAVDEGGDGYVIELREGDLEAVLEVVKRAGWLTGAPDGGGDGPRRVEVQVRNSGADRRFVILGAGRDLDDRTAAVLATLQEIATRRYGDVLDGLPKGR